MAIWDNNDLSNALGRWLQVVDFQDHDDESTLYNPDVTFSYSKYSCIRSFYFVHMVFNYLIFLSGIACMVTRLMPPSYRRFHRWFGYVYINCMLWTTGSSLLINNTGLPLSVLISFSFVAGGLTVGWMLIKFYQIQMDQRAFQHVQEQLTSSKEDPFATNSLQGLVSDAKTKILQEQTFWQRFLSLKTAHGLCFFVSWFSIAGRLFNSNQSGDFTCYTYPVYKPISTPQGNFTGQNLTLVPAEDPDYDSLPWANGAVSWTMAITFGSAAMGIFFGAILTYFYAWWDRKSLAQQEATDGGKAAQSAAGSDDISEKSLVPVEAVVEDQA